LSYAPDKQTNRQTDGLKHPTNADRLCRQSRSAWVTILSMLYDDIDVSYYNILSSLGRVSECIEFNVSFDT